MEKETLKYVISSFHERPLPKVVPRHLELPLDADRAVALVGIRRCGKTWLLYDTMRRLNEIGVAKKCLIYINFEDDRFFPVKLEELDQIIRAHGELYPELIAQKKYFFFDEVQNVPGWEKFVRRILDTENARVFLTGSSSHLLTRQLVYSMRGRTISYEVFPLSFAEFLSFRGIVFNAYSHTSEDQCAAALREYLSTGGFPEVVLAHPELRPKLLSEYTNLILYKDLLERYSLANPHLMKLLLKYCLTRPGTLLSVHKLYKDFRSQGLSLSKDALYQYMNHLQESYVIFAIPLKDTSHRRQAVNPKKIFTIDPILAHPFVPEQILDRGRKLENLVFLHWRRQREDIYYWPNGSEIDLVVGESQCEEIINVTQSLNIPEVYEREVTGLSGAYHANPNARYVLVAEEINNPQTPPGITVIPAWKYLLQPPASQS